MKVVLPSESSSRCLSVRGILDMRLGDKRWPLESVLVDTPGPYTGSEGVGRDCPGRMNVPCLEPISTIAHSFLSSSQYTVACSFETSISFSLILGISAPGGATSLPNWICVYPSVIASWCERGMTALACFWSPSFSGQTRRSRRVECPKSRKQNPKMRSSANMHNDNEHRLGPDWCALASVVRSRTGQQLLRLLSSHFLCHDHRPAIREKDGIPIRKCSLESRRLPCLLAEVVDEGSPQVVTMI